MTLRSAPNNRPSRTTWTTRTDTVAHYRGGRGRHSLPADFPHVFHKRRHATPLRPRRGDNAWPRSSARAALRAAVRAEPGTMPKIARIRNLTRSSARFPIRTVRSDLTWKPTVRGRAPGAAAAWAVPRPAASSPRPQDRRLRPDKARGNPGCQAEIACRPTALACDRPRSCRGRRRARRGSSRPARPVPTNVRSAPRGSSTPPTACGGAAGRCR